MYTVYNVISSKARRNVGKRKNWILYWNRLTSTSANEINHQSTKNWPEKENLSDIFADNYQQFWKGPTGTGSGNLFSNRQWLKSTMSNLKNGGNGKETVLQQFDCWFKVKEERSLRCEQWRWTPIQTRENGNSLSRLRFRQGWQKTYHKQTLMMPTGNKHPK
jgi:hypothetical protein